MNVVGKTRLRTKTGCLTCKFIYLWVRFFWDLTFEHQGRQRRKKCDEKLPICGNCISSHRDCQWPTFADLYDRRYASHSESRHRENLSKFQESGLNYNSLHKLCRSSHGQHKLFLSGAELSSSAVAQRVLSQELDCHISRHFVNKFYSLLLLPYCHTQYHDGWLSELRQAMETHKSLYYSILACAASHMSIIDASSNMKYMALGYYTNSVRELSSLLSTISQDDKNDGLLMTIMMLSLHGLASWDTNCDIPQHIQAGIRLLTLHVLNKPLAVSRLFDRLSLESVMYAVFISTASLWSDSTGSHFTFDNVFWNRAEQVLGQTNFFPENSGSSDSPVLGVSVSLFRIALSLRHIFRTGILPEPSELQRLQHDVADWEGLLLEDQNLLNYLPDDPQGRDFQEDYHKTAIHLFTLVTSLLLGQILRGGVLAGLPQTISRGSWQMSLAIQIVEKYANDRVWATCFIVQWPIYTLGVLMELPEDRQLIRKQLQQSCDVTSFAQVARYSYDLETIWTTREGVAPIDEEQESEGGLHLLF
ncbi:unnamed protein product [Clonostachys solani]|uniref:Zn(2)-C6 fungal-type domain-containing protein n=1 Tax=Clonostachys solani TaxID=160281 RepID=A0A9N9Z851_9HYPO|nr:unnamed protein product [Clonostachys solani]